MKPFRMSTAVLLVSAYVVVSAGVAPSAGWAADGGKNLVGRVPGLLGIIARTRRALQEEPPPALSPAPAEAEETPAAAADGAAAAVPAPAEASASEPPERPETAEVAVGPSHAPLVPEAP